MESRIYGTERFARLNRRKEDAYYGWKPWLHDVRAIIYDSTYRRCFWRGDHTVGWYTHRGEQV